MKVDCSHASSCAGCPQIDHDYDTQLAAKHARIARAFARYVHPSGSAAPPDLTPTRAPVAMAPVLPASIIEQYRTRTKLVVAPGPRIGLFARTGEHVVVDIPDCRVMSLACREVVAVVRRLCETPATRNAAVWTPYDPASRRGALRGLDVREAVDEQGSVRVVLTLLVDAQAPVSDDTLARAGAEVMSLAPNVACVAAALHDGRNPRLLGAAPHVLCGDARVRDVVDAAGTWQFASAGAFVQAHRAQARTIGERIVGALGASDRVHTDTTVLELYAGSGALGLQLARAGATVTMVESFAGAAEDAQLAAAAQSLRVSVIRGDAVRVASQWATERRAVDLVVVNPPRRGLAPEVREAIGALRPRQVAYVSCEPESLARDMAHFARLGLATDRIEAFDMIPLTDEVETLAVLRRVSAAQPAMLWHDDEVAVFDADPFESTTPQGERSGSLLDRVRLVPGFEQAVAVHRLDAGTSGVCLFARSSRSVDAWARAIGATDARKEYVALCKGITRDKGTIRQPLRDGGKLRDATTRFSRTEVVSGHSVVRIVIEHGRTHQIRRHMATIGHPVLGDERHGHGATNRHALERWLLDRTFLHAARLSFLHPRSGEQILVESPMPGDLVAVLDRMRESSR